MPSEPRARRLAAVSILALAAVAACTSGPPRPTTPTYSGVLRPDPSRPPRPGDPLPSAPVSDVYAESRNAYMPRHIPRNELSNVKRVAVLLPFSSTNAEVQKQSRGLYNAIQMALFERNVRDVVLMPRDATSSDAQTIANITEQAVRDGAIAVIGPVFAQQVPAVASEAAEVRAPVLAFSTDASAIGRGAYLMSLTPQTEVERIVDWAATQGIDRFAMFGPDTANGHSIEAALRQEAAERGGAVIGVEYYQAGSATPQNEARRLAIVIKAEHAAHPGKVAVLIPEQGVQLRSVASLLPYFDVNPREVRFLGTGQWNDPDVWREPSLYGGAFPAPDPAALADFEKRYQAIFGEAAPKLASFGYDAGALAATLADANRLDAAMIQRPQGWAGVNGLFRFLPDGSVERALAIMQLQDRGGIKIVSPPIQAFAPGS